jgi:DNA-binding Xre family transcriptional regulator
MAFCYKKLWHQLIDHDMSRTDLRDATGMAPATLAKLSKGEAVGTPTLEKICRVLQCNIGDIMDYVPETHRIQGNNDGDNLGGGQRTCQM